MINAIPPMVSGRGSLPHIVDGDVSEREGGRVLLVLDPLTFSTERLSMEHEVEPWSEAVCTLWDNPAALYYSMATQAQRITNDRYGEEVSRRPHVDYFALLRPPRRRSRRP
jgi:hypothetical protein